MRINKKSYIRLFKSEFDIIEGTELISADEVISWIETFIDYINKKLEFKESEG
jgi:hypothetical protein